ncbi:MAG: nitrite reductase small subunit NirD [Pseudomonadota bacterium]
MNAVTSRWIAVGQLGDIPRRGARTVEAGPRRIAIFRTAADAVYALEDRCPHRNGPLSEGIVHDGCVTCPLHNWVIALDSGTAQGADEGVVETYPVRLDGDTVLLDIGALR